MPPSMPQDSRSTSQTPTPETMLRDVFRSVNTTPDLNVVTASQTRPSSVAYDALGDPANDASGDPANDASGGPANDASDDPANGALDDPANDASGDPANDVSDDPFLPPSRHSSPPPSRRPPPAPPRHSSSPPRHTLSSSWTPGPQHRTYLRYAVPYLVGVSGMPEWRELLERYVTFEGLSFAKSVSIFSISLNSHRTDTI